MGDSLSPLYYLITSSLVNVGLDLLFVAVLGMGVIGVAVATVLSQLVSVILVFRKMIRTNDVYKLTVKALKIDRNLLRQVFALGMPAAIHGCVVSVSDLFLLRYVNSFGSAAMAGIGSAKKIDKFITIVADSLGLTVATFIGQNLGAWNFKRIKQGIRSCVALALGTVAVIGSVVYIFAPTFIKIFTSDSKAVAYGVDMIHAIVPLYAMQTFNSVFVNVSRGFGKAKFAMLCSIGGIVICRQAFLAIAMSFSHNVAFVYYSYPVGWGTAGLAELFYYLFYIRRVHIPRLMRGHR